MMKKESLKLQIEQKVYTLSNNKHNTGHDVFGINNQQVTIEKA